MPAATYLGVNEHFEPFCNAVMASAVVFQQAARVAGADSAAALPGAGVAQPFDTDQPVCIVVTQAEFASHPVMRQKAPERFGRKLHGRTVMRGRDHILRDTLIVRKVPMCRDIQIKTLLIHRLKTHRSIIT
ncbi:MAG: hypothetical protein FD165_61 [Gammaproteobacteria bacterium]|nr:MAG: hypothetical protein FD165_61 [Gammaproteobacteria bacterium]